jgi:hypothetical protein
MTVSVSVSVSVCLCVRVSGVFVWRRCRIVFLDSCTNESVASCFAQSTKIAGLHAFFVFAMWYIAACPSVADAGPDGAPCMHGRKSTFKHSNPWSFESGDIVDANRDLHPISDILCAMT